jgi:gamma-glutamyltranspeptidase / glutathione hydrolase
MKGMVVCPQPRAADVGAEVLERGGNAFDATIATAFAQMVVDPFMCGIGGMGTLQYFDTRGAGHGMIDFHNRAGSKVVPGMWEADLAGRSAISGYTLFDDFRSELGYTSVMTPGTVTGFDAAHRRLATWDWKDLLAPASRLARDGYPLAAHVRDFWAKPSGPGIADGITRLKASKACADIYLRAGDKLPDVGDLIRNPDMADTIDILARDGASSFYTGALAGRIADDIAANGGFVTAEDLAGYEIRSGKPVFGTYRGLTVASNPPPGSGAVLIQMLRILDHFDLGALGHGTAESLHLIASAMAHAHHDRELHLADPDFTPVDVDFLVSTERAAEHAAAIRASAPTPLTPPSPPSCTTHLSVRDEAGNAVSVTHTLGTGSGVVTPGLGFVYNNSMKLADPIPGRANSMMPGKARTTGMVPTMLLRDGEPVIIVGALGGSVIISAVLQTIVNIVDHGMSPVEAVTVPRIHCEGAGVHVEARVEASQIAGLRALGHEVIQSAHSFDPVMARAHVIARDERGWRGGADPRSGGAIAIARR